MKKILFVASVVKVHIMVFHLPYLKWLKDNGYEVHVAAKNDYINKSDLNIPYCDKFHDIDFSRKPYSYKNIKAYFQLKEIIKKEKFDLMHCHTPIGSAIGRLAAKEYKDPKLKVLYTAHGFHFYKGSSIINWLLYYPLEYYLSNYTDVIFTINDEDYQVAKRMKANKNILIPGIGIDVNKIQENITINKRNCNDVITLISVGELNKNKNHRVVIESLANFTTKKFKYLICGEGPELESLKKLVTKYRLNDHVHFLGFRTNVLEIVSKADIFVFPSYREGLSVSLMESMALGLPVIASNIRGNRDLIDDMRGGILVNPDDSDDIYYALNKLIENSEMRNQFGRYNQEKVKNYSLDNVIREVTNIYLKYLT